MLDKPFDMILDLYVNSVDSIPDLSAVSVDAVIAQNVLLSVTAMKFPLARTILQKIHNMAIAKPNDVELGSYLRTQLSDPNRLLALGIEAVQVKEKQRNAMTLPNPLGQKGMALVVDVQNFNGYLSDLLVAVGSLPDEDRVFDDSSREAKFIQAMRFALDSLGGVTTLEAAGKADAMRMAMTVYESTFSQYAKAL
jgi:hypothetical protein